MRKPTTPADPRGAAAVVLGTLIAACVPREQLTLPPAGDAASVLIAMVPQGGASDPLLYAFPSLDSVFVPVTASRDVAVDAYVLLYSCDLESLGWTTGRISLAASSDVDARALPLPTTIFKGGFDARALDWTEVQVAPEALVSVKVKATGATPCSKFESRAFRIPNSARTGVSLAVALDASRALVSPQTKLGGSALFFEVTTATISLVRAATSTTPNNAAVQFDDGTLLIVGSGGISEIGTVNDGFVRIPTLVSGGTQRAWLDRSHEGPREAFVVTDQGGFDWYDGDAWTQIHPDGPAIAFGGVVRTATKEALAIGPDPSGVLVSRDRETTTETYMDIGLNGDPIALVSFPGSAPVLVGENGQIFSRTQKWDLTTTVPGVNEIRCATSFNGTLIFAHNDDPPGYVRQLFLPDILCEEAQVADVQITILAPFSGGFIAISKNVDDDAFAAIVLETSHGAPCLAKSIVDFKGM